jgi:hypothetical protein
MKKFYYIVGAAVTAASIFALIAVMLRKIRISLSIEGVEDDILEDLGDGEITLSIEKDEEPDEDFSEEIETIISEEGSDQL